VPTSEHVYEQNFEFYLTGLIQSSKDSVIEVHRGECKACVVKLSTADDALCKRAELSDMPAKEKRR
jgi:hypothetical protein